MINLIPFLFIYIFSSVANSQETGLTVQQSIDEALKKNPKLIIQRDEVESCKNDVIISAASFFPKVKLKTGHQKQSKDSYATSILSQQTNSPVERSENVYNIGAEIEQILYSGGYNLSDYRYKKKKLEIAQRQLELDESSVILEVKKLYYTILQLKNNISVLVDALEFLQNHVKKVEAKVKERVALKSDLLSAELQVLDGQKNLIEARNSYNAASIQFCNLLGKENTPDIELKGELTQPEYEINLDRSIEDSINSNPEILISQMELESANLSVEMAKSGMNRPQMKMVGNYNYTEDVWPPEENDWSVGVGIEIPLFEGGKPYAQVKKAGLKSHQAETNLTYIKQKIVSNIRQSNYEFIRSKEALKVSSKLLEQAEENFRICSLGYEGGTIPHERLLKSQNELTSAKIGYYQSLYDYNAAIAKFEFATAFK